MFAGSHDSLRIHRSTEWHLTAQTAQPRTNPSLAFSPLYNRRETVTCSPPLLRETITNGGVMRRPILYTNRHKFIELLIEDWMLQGWTILTASTRNFFYIPT